jgi:hypothetical protein
MENPNGPYTQGQVSLEEKGRGRFDTHWQREGHMKMELVQPQAKECLELAEAGKS